MTDKKQIRPAEDRADQTRLTVDDLYKDYEVTNPALLGTLHIKGLPEGLHAHFTTNDPRNIARIKEQGYRPLEEVKTTLGFAVDGVYTHTNGDRVKIFVCSEKHRDMRAEQVKQQQQAQVNVTYQDEKELPISGDRVRSGHGLPPGYIPDSD
jgi:hypothetical protein